MKGELGRIHVQTTAQQRSRAPASHPSHRPRLGVPSGVGTKGKPATPALRRLELYHGALFPAPGQALHPRVFDDGDTASIAPSDAVRSGDPDVDDTASTASGGGPPDKRRRLDPDTLEEFVDVDGIAAARRQLEALAAGELSPKQRERLQFFNEFLQQIVQNFEPRDVDGPREILCRRMLCDRPLRTKRKAAIAASTHRKHQDHAARLVEDTATRSSTTLPRSTRSPPTPSGCSGQAPREGGSTVPEAPRSPKIVRLQRECRPRGRVLPRLRHAEQRERLRREGKKETDEEIDRSVFALIAQSEEDRILAAMRQAQLSARMARLLCRVRRRLTSPTCRRDRAGQEIVEKPLTSSRPCRGARGRPSSTTLPRCTRSADGRRRRGPGRARGGLAGRCLAHARTRQTGTAAKKPSRNSSTSSRIARVAARGGASSRVQTMAAVAAARTNGGALPVYKGKTQPRHGARARRCRARPRFCARAAADADGGQLRRPSRRAVFSRRVARAGRIAATSPSSPALEALVAKGYRDGRGVKSRGQEQRPAPASRGAAGGRGRRRAFASTTTRRAASWP